MKSILILSVIIIVCVVLCNLNSVSAGGQTKNKHKLQKNRKIDKNGCKMNLLTDLPENEPVYLHQKRKSFTLYKPNGKQNVINKNLILLCSGKKNKLTTINSNSTVLTCPNNHNSKTKNISKEYDLKQFNCTNEVIGNIKITKNKCGVNNQGQIILIGFKINTKAFIETYKICYNNLTASTFWSKHSINGKAIKYNVKESTRHEFKNNGIRNDIRPTNSYKKSAQIQHFSSTLGGHQQYFNNTSYLAKGHLTPDADFIFTSAQFSTYFYLNVVPQFQSINNGNWRRVENLARSLAAVYNTDLTIYTGVYDQLTLSDGHHKNTLMFLESNGKMPVPKWLWKIIHNEANNSAIVLLTLNNPFVMKTSDVQNLCENICDKAELNSKHFTTIRKGYTICCELNAFKNVVKTLLPLQLITADKLLSCANASFDKP